MIQRIYIIFENGSYHYAHGSGFETLEIREAKAYPNMVEAEYAAKDLHGVVAIKLEEDARYTAQCIRDRLACSTSS
jgi:hypothetical protein